MIIAILLTAFACITYERFLPDMIYTSSGGAYPYGAVARDEFFRRYKLSSFPKLSLLFGVLLAVVVDLSHLRSDVSGIFLVVMIFLYGVWVIIDVVRVGRLAGMGRGDRG